MREKIRSIYLIELAKLIADKKIELTWNLPEYEEYFRTYEYQSSHLKGYIGSYLM